MSNQSKLVYQNSTNIYVLRACHHEDAVDLIAVGGEHSVEIIHMSSLSLRVIASFHIGSRITALAWSSRTISPSVSDDWVLELSAAGADFGLHLLTKSANSDEDVFPFGGGLSGHHGLVNDMSFCGGRGEDSSRYVASVSDDKMLMVWDLYPDIDIASGLPSPIRSPEVDLPKRPQPTAYVIPFPHPLTAVDSHPSTSKEFLVSDCRGQIFIIDWRSDPDEEGNENWRHRSAIELVDPRALSESLTGISMSRGGSASWRKDTFEIVGAVYGKNISIWDVTKAGGRPLSTAVSFPEGGHKFRWSPTTPELFAISTAMPLKGAIIHVHNSSYIHARPTILNIAPRPQRLRDFDFLAVPGIPHLAVAVANRMHILQVSMGS